MKHKLLLLFALTIGWASSTWALDQVSGLYKIGTKQDLFDFATLVNGGATGVHAILIDDIDLENAAWTPIGNSSKKYTGIFDGGGFTISNFSLTTTAADAGLFGSIADGAIVKNFTIEGNISSTHQYVGVIGSTRGGTTYISNIHSKLNISTNQSRQGGILGSNQGSGTETVNIDRCTYSGTITPSNGGNIGGFVGFARSNTSASINITNCLFDGTIENGTKTGDMGGFVGYCNNGKVTIKYCLSNGTVHSAKPGQFFGTLNDSNCKCEGKNYFVTGNVVGSLKSGKTLGGTAPVTATSTQLTSGELCVLLNNADHGTNWYQDLSASEKKYPKPNGTEKVYKYDSYEDCSATTPTTDVISYTNTPTIASHTYTDGICSVCGSINPSYATIDSDGFYEIDSPEKLKWFSAWVNSSGDNLYSNAVLKSDIDMTSIASSWTPIGSWSAIYSGNAAYKGHFNGGGYAITNLTGDTHQNYYGLFGVISAGCIIENFSISGTISNTNRQYVGGVAAYARDATPTIRNVKSSVNFNNTNGSARLGGILGGAMNGTTNIQNCTYTDATIHNDNIAGNYGGIVGYANNNASAILTISNCLFKGTVENLNGGAGECGGIIGYASTSSTTTIENCLSVGTVTATNAGMICGIISGTKTYTNNYYKEGDVDANGPSSNEAYTAEEVSTTRLGNGEICYALNGDQSNIAFYQAVGIDANPVLDSTHGQVYVNGTVCPDTSTPQGTVTYSNLEGTSVGSHDFVDGFCSYCNFLQSDYLTRDGEYYVIGGVDGKKHLKWFAAYVNEGHPAAKAKLTTDIDLTGVTMQPIGNASVTFTGEFDGQCHAITNFSTDACQYNGLFGKISNATIKDFTISGTNDGIETLASGPRNHIGVIGQAVGDDTEISGIHSSLKITVKCDSQAGGVVGGADGHPTIKNCSYSGTLTVNSGITGDQFGGIVGYTSYGTIKNCFFNGTVTGIAPGRGFGGIVGYCREYIQVLQNCLSIGTVSGSGDGVFNGAIIGNYNKSDVSSTEKVKNNYFLSGGVAGCGNNPTMVSTTEKTAVEMASGEVCYLLNGNQSEINWYQTIGTDDYPTLDSSSEQVRYVGSAGYTTFYDATNDWELLGDAHAYIGTINGYNNLHLEEIEDIPANTAVVIGGTYYNKVSTTATATTTGNVLLGSDGTVKGGANIYALAKKGDPAVVGFYPVGSEVTIPAGKAYLDLTGSPVREFFTFVFDEDETSLSEELRVKSEESTNAVYDLSGRKINSHLSPVNSQLKKGIYIVKGKKVLK